MRDNLENFPYPPQSWSYSPTVSRPTASQSTIPDLYEQVQQLDSRVKTIEDKLAELGPVLQDDQAVDKMTWG